MVPRYRKLEKINKLNNTELENLIYGIRPIHEAIKEGKIPEKVLFQQGPSGDNFKSLFHLIRKLNIPFQMVPIEKLNKISKGNHQGVIAFLPLINYISVEELIKNITKTDDIPLVIILDKITDIRNLGAIARSAECAGAHGIIIQEKGSAPINAEAIKTSAGALSRIPVCREKDLMETIEFLRLCEISIIACTEKAYGTIYSEDLTKPVALIMGSEDKGISPYLLKLADSKVSIPMKGKTASLNVSVAAGIVLFEVNRQRL